MWTGDELNKIGKAEELQIAFLRKDDTLQKPVIIWVVRVGDGLYVRCVNGREGVWFKGTQTRHAGLIRAGGVEKNVLFLEETDPAVHERIDAAYREKYRRYPKEYVDVCVTPTAQAATIKLAPRPEEG